ncbi:YiiD C-terminal domain-containing protein [Gracilimonas sp.]|uniref:YiiD C-terminal domain-containing protein n=1 Tax=Gracilimonas sp. TaxID=1974203 RepID=UPI0028722BF2|nr:YiiD C-terminal domain-containing protein [Gracilimonas sp.]
MTKTQIEQYLYKHIPITRALGVKAIEFSRNEVKFLAPLMNNINHRSTAFGGSISSLLITTGWSYLRLLFDDEEIIPRIVIGKSETKYIKPISADFTSQLVIPDEEEVQHFLEMVHRFGKGRITLQAQIIEGEEVLAVFEGDYVIFKQNTETDVA